MEKQMDIEKKRVEEMAGRIDRDGENKERQRRGWRYKERDSFCLSLHSIFLTVIQLSLSLYPIFCMSLSSLISAIFRVIDPLSSFNLSVSLLPSFCVSLSSSYVFIYLLISLKLPSFPHPAFHLFPLHLSSLSIPLSIFYPPLFFFLLSYRYIRND